MEREHRAPSVNVWCSIGDKKKHKYDNCFETL